MRIIKNVIIWHFYKLFSEASNVISKKRNIQIPLKIPLENRLQTWKNKCKFRYISGKNENCKFSPDFISRIRESTILPNRNAHNLCINATNGVPDIDQVSFPRLEIDHKKEPMEVQCRYWPSQLYPRRYHQWRSGAKVPHPSSVYRRNRSWQAPDPTKGTTEVGNKPVPVLV